jgi:hypothetical protein
VIFSQDTMGVVDRRDLLEVSGEAKLWIGLWHGKALGLWENLEKLNILLTYYVYIYNIYIFLYDLIIYWWLWFFIQQWFRLGNSLQSATWLCHGKTKNTARPSEASFMAYEGLMTCFMPWINGLFNKGQNLQRTMVFFWDVVGFPINLPLH